MRAKRKRRSKKIKSSKRKRESRRWTRNRKRRMRQRWRQRKRRITRKRSTIPYGSDILLTTKLVRHSLPSSLHSEQYSCQYQNTRTWSSSLGLLVVVCVPYKLRSCISGVFTSESCSANEDRQLTLPRTALSQLTSNTPMGHFVRIEPHSSATGTVQHSSEVLALFWEGGSDSVSLLRSLGSRHTEFSGSCFLTKTKGLIILQIV